MGVTGIGRGDDVTAWIFNPAGLPDMKITPRAGQDVLWQAMIGMDVNSDAPLDEKFFYIGGVTNNQGFAVGRIKGDDINASATGGGYGFKLSNHWSIGAALVQVSADTEVLFDAVGATSRHHHHDSGNSANILNASLMYQWVPSWGDGMPTKLTLGCADVLGHFDIMDKQRLYVAGLSTNIGRKFQLDVDCLDLDNKTDYRLFNAGAQYQLDKRFALRAGCLDFNDSDVRSFTYGAGYRFCDGWSLDAGQIRIKPMDNSTQTVVSLSKDF